MSTISSTISSKLTTSNGTFGNALLHLISPTHKPLDTPLKAGRSRRPKGCYRIRQESATTLPLRGSCPGGTTGGTAPTDTIETDAELVDYIKSSAFTNWHASCTCKMGTMADLMAVVDSKAKVIGVDGLRVVDASSFALLPPAS